jgi:hypothetical protein
MSGYQFIHIETYAKVSTKKGKPSIQSVVNETMRSDGYCPHVDQPQCPEILYGLDPMKLPQIALDRANKAKDKQGRKIRKDAPLLLGGVVSIGADSDANFSDFIKCSISFLRNKYKQNLASIVLHLDEGHPHLHFYVVPSVKDGGFSMAEIHDGIKARNECNGGYSKKAHAYKSAMRAFQDSYYDNVGSKLGLTRLGPRVQRVSRKQWKAQQKQAQALSQQRRELNKQHRQIAIDKAVMDVQRQEIDSRETELTIVDNASFFQKKNEKKNIYLRKRLNKILSDSDDITAQLGDKQEQLMMVKRELKTFKQANSAYLKKFDAMNYKLELKDQFIRQLKFRRDNKNEKRHTRSEQCTYQL